MADVQAENGFTKIANELLEVVMQQKFNGTQFKIIMAVWRFTYGFCRKEHEMSLTFLSNATGVHKQQIKMELAKLIELNVIKVTSESSYTTSRKLSFNKNYDEWNQSQSVKKVPVSESTYTTVSEITTTTVSESTYQERNIKENSKENIYTIFDHWNSKKIMVHRELNQKRKSAINARLVKYSIDQLVAAINNYDQILKGEEYFWSYKWSLEDFMNPKNLDRFLDENEPFKNFAKDKKNVKSIADHRKQKEIDRFNFDMQLGRWVDGGNDPNDFIYKP